MQDRSQIREIRRKRRRIKGAILFLLVTLLIVVISLLKSFSSRANTEKAIQPIQPLKQEFVLAPVLAASPTIILDAKYIQREARYVTWPIEEPRISDYEPGEQYFYEFLTDEEKIYIAKVVYKEARGESFVGQVAVAAVILNRYVSDDPFFENDTIYSVITQNNQFADISNVTEANLENYPDCMRAVEAAAKGWDPTREVFEEGAKYFYDPEGLTSEYQKKIRTGIEEMVIGNHHFHNDFADVN